MRRAKFGLVYMTICVVAVLSLAASLPSNSRNCVSPIEELVSNSICRVDSNYQSESELHYVRPLELTVDRNNNLYISAIEKWAVFKVDPAGTITTMVGNGKPGRLREGAAATAVGVRPLALAFDDEGSLYVADADSFRVFKVLATGTISFVAGNGTEGHAGDGGPALAANLYAPTGLAFGPDKSLLILDGADNRIRKVSPDGIIRTIAGTGEKGYGGDGGPATAASLNSPSDIAVDRAGNLLVADDFNYRIRKIDNRGTITTVAGNGMSGGYKDEAMPAIRTPMSAPLSIAFDDNGNLFIADGSIRRLDKWGVITTVAGHGVGKTGLANQRGFETETTLILPFSITVDHEGNLYAAEWAVRYSKTRVRKINPAGIITTVYTDAPPPAN
jgi:sugar lactone lactonase YvrE